MVKQFGINDKNKNLRGYKMGNNLIRILETEDWIIDYDKERDTYRVSYFEDNHFVDEIWFDSYEKIDRTGE